MIGTKYAVIIMVSFAAGFASMVGVGKLTKQEIRVECPQPVCPEFKCPGNSIDFEKVKNFKGTLKVEQHYHMVVSGDSLFREELGKDIETKLNNLRVSRCK